MRRLAAACLLLAACGSGAPVATVSPYGGVCTSREGLPDPRCTPGDTDPRVTPGNVRETICRRGYTASVRPPKEASHLSKLAVTKAYGVAGVPFAEIELDHLIPLSLGGSSDPRNLWPQFRTGPANVADKDAIASSLNRRVCRGLLGLRQAQRAMARDWRTAG